MSVEVMDPAHREALRQRLRKVHWVGGASGAGKSTVARQLEARRGLHRYGTDEAMGDHVSRLHPDEAPSSHAFVTMDMDERWVHRTPEEMLGSFHWFRGEGFDLIIEDLLGLPEELPVVAEGFRLLPHLVEPLVADPRRAVWLLPTPELRAAAFDARRPSGAPWSFVTATSDPARALRNLLDRDRMFTDQLRHEVRRLGLASIEVDVGMTEEEVLRRIESMLELD